MDDNQILFATLTVVIAVATVGINIVNFCLARKRRLDDLFDRRYKFYKDFESFWKSTGSESKGATQMMVEWEDVLAWELEASFLFGEDIVKHIRSYQGKSFDGEMPWIPDLELAKPFKKYLKL